ncbi:uncharacterized protein BYT42DRAFT_587002 [Radiomyces spectabilis]|uniref:uncharacterized protein n=1 Tax=Radiomyces spectabilis TaxID=64574 RepID=UPI00221FB3FA|nr:uncharacterized protein BYT42DRAFT_587002 [Radiomyces spectabilis]KAI8367655.1 hypothetical protein BYT42DRAFT_587002 [Radiomyces spectabilis]
METITCNPSSSCTLNHSYAHACPQEDARFLRYSHKPTVLPSVNLPMSKPAAPSASSSINPLFYNLQDVVAQYRSQPELLKLILASKVEEDKRRAEEAKLRAKELDLHIQRHHRVSSLSLENTGLREKRDRELVSKDILRRSSGSSHGSNNSDGAAAHRAATIAPYPLPMRRDSIRNSLDISSLHHQQRRNSAAAAMLAMGSVPQASSQTPTTLTSPSSTSSTSSSSYLQHQSAYPSPSPDYYDIHDKDDRPAGRGRRRREMQAITKIVETREFPYNDNHFWKNNGNTIQKKTGCKSVYYKCTNSTKGCPVNKTVTAKPTGEYLIKYRGDHLPECGHVERIVDL